MPHHVTNVIFIDKNFFNKGEILGIKKLDSAKLISDILKCRCGSNDNILIPIDCNSGSRVHRRQVIDAIDRAFWVSQIPKFKSRVQAS